MRRFGFLVFILAVTVAAIHPAFALTTEQGNEVPSTTANVTDPDESAPAYLNSSQDQNGSGFHFGVSGESVTGPSAVARPGSLLGNRLGMPMPPDQQK